jgi:cytochrome oxidase Cu insertion factor (SCO1/SenC/PrrC family)
MQKKKLSARLAMPLWAALLAVLCCTSALAQSKPAENPSSMPKVGEMAPDFTLSYFDGNDLKPVSLSQYRGKKNVVVAFFVFAFTGG